MSRSPWLQIRSLALVAASCTALGCNAGDSSEANAQPDKDAGGGEPSASLTREPCDPFAPHMQPIELGKIIGAGKDAQGTIYVAAERSVDDGDAYVLVSDDAGTLVRQRVAGSGQDGELKFEFTVDDHEPAFALSIDLSASDAPRILLATGPLGDDKFPTQGEELTSVPDEVIRAMPLRNLPGEIELAYAVQLPDASFLIVTEPVDDVHYEDFHVFLGPADQILERDMVQVSRGNSTHIVFDLDGMEAEAFFPAPPELGGGGGEPSSPELTVGAVTQPLTELDERPEGVSYECFVGH